MSQGPHAQSVRTFALRATIAFSPLNVFVQRGFRRLLWGGPAEGFAGAPHAVKEHRKLAREFDTRLRTTGSSGDSLAPVFHSAGAPYPAHNDIDGFIEMCAGEYFAAPRNAATSIDLAGLILPRR